MYLNNTVICFVSFFCLFFDELIALLQLQILQHQVVCETSWIYLLFYADFFLFGDDSWNNVPSPLLRFIYLFSSSIFPADLFWGGGQHSKWWQSIFSLRIKGKIWKDSKLCVTVVSWSLCALAAGVIKLVCATEK